MKKIFTLIAITCLVFCAATSQTAGNGSVEAIDSYKDIDTEVIKIEDTYGAYHPKAKTVTIELEHTPLTGEVRLYYTCMASSFDQGEAMNTAIAVYEDFALKNKYKHYSYAGKDKTSYKKDDRGVRMATYVSHVIFKY
jgi:hypothetical protein